MRAPRRLAIVAAFAMICGAPDKPQAQTKAFEVASVKPNKSGTGSSSSRTSRERVTFTNAPMSAILRFAYGIKDHEFSAPDWFNFERYDIVAKAPEGTPESDLPFMMQTLLMDRFKLVFHIEEREVPAYALVVDKGGAKIKQITDDVLSNSSGSSFGSSAGLSTMSTLGTLASFASNLSRSPDIQRPVIDKTGLAGKYQISLRYQPFSAQAGENGGPSIFKALQEQLGLRLEARKTSIRFYVVDHAEKIPIENQHD